MLLTTALILPIRYDFNRHYRYHHENKSNGGLIPGYVEILDPDFTIKERIQRYFCRLLWLIRNNGYGFAYEVLGANFNPKYHVVEIDEERKNYIHWKSYIVNKPEIWCYSLTKPWCKWFQLRIYLGWKLRGFTHGIPNQRAMLACHVTFLHRVEK